MRQNAALALSLIFLGSIAANAAEFAPQQSAKPEKTVIKNYAVDYFGVVPGMNPEEVRTALAVNFNTLKLSAQDKVLPMKVGGDVLTSQHYTAELAGKFISELQDNSFHGYFSSPSSGNQLVGFEQSMIYHTRFDAPNVGKVVNFFGQKFGEPSQINRDGDTLHLVWIYKNNELQHCSFVEPCPTATVEYATDRLKYYLASNPTDFIVVADISRRKDVPLVSQVNVKMLDLKKRSQVAKIDNEIFTQETARLVDQHPPVAPLPAGQAH